MKKLEYTTALALAVTLLFTFGQAVYMFFTEYGVVGPLLMMAFGLVIALLIICLYMIASFVRMAWVEVDKRAKDS